MYAIWDMNRLYPVFLRRNMSKASGIIRLFLPVIAGLIIFRCVFAAVYIPTASMEPSIRAGTVRIAWRLPFFLGTGHADREDVIVFRREGEQRLLCKRVTGIEGDTVEIKNGSVILNGTVLSEDYLSPGTATEGEMIVTVPKGKLFVLGDNRSISKDSRYWEDPFIGVAEIYARIK